MRNGDKGRRKKDVPKTKYSITRKYIDNSPSLNSSHREGKEDEIVSKNVERGFTHLVSGFQFSPDQRFSTILSLQISQRIVS
jgi:hypothetical protein